MARRFEVLLPLVSQLDQTREEQDHVPSLVHNRAMAIIAPDFAWQAVLGGFRARVVPFEVVVAVGEVDVFFVEDGCPLEGGSWDAGVSIALV